MNFLFKETKLNEIKPLIQKYINTLSSQIDSFIEERILHSVFYSIHLNSELVGYYAIYNHNTLIQFYLELTYLNESQEIFNRVLKEHPIQSILVPTCDELFLSLVVDHDYKMEKQAYFFKDSKAEIPTEKLNKEGEFRLAVMNDIAKIEAVCKDFYDRLEQRIETGEIFVFEKGDILLGSGIIEQSKLQDQYASIGMYTNEQYRNKGIGRTILHQLKEWCYEHQLTPIAGCWYYNTFSKLTLESAGMVTKTRLLNFKVI